MKKRRKIALIVESSRGYGRDVLQGIANFAQSHDNWEIVYQESHSVVTPMLTFRIAA